MLVRRCFAVFLFLPALTTASVLPPACAGLSPIELEELGGTGCRHLSLVFKDFEFRDTGIGLVSAKNIEFGDAVQISAMVRGDPAETSGFRVGFTIEGLTRPFVRTLRAQGTCEVNLEPGDPQPGPITFAFVGDRNFSARCGDIEGQTFTVTEIVPPQDPYREEFFFRVGIIPRTTSATFTTAATYDQLIPEPSAFVLLASGLGAVAHLGRRKMRTKENARGPLRIFVAIGLHTCLRSIGTSGISIPLALRIRQRPL